MTRTTYQVTALDSDGCTVTSQKPSHSRQRVS